MLTVRGVYTGKFVKPLTKINKKPNTPVIITFLDEDVAAQLAAAKVKYQELAKDFAFGETPGESYAKEMMAEYFSSFSKI
jgi:hypothetical protein